MQEKVANPETNPVGKQTIETLVQVNDNGKVQWGEFRG